MSEQYFTRPNVQPVITNIGTTPEQRQMSASEFKAKFDEMPEAIQQYIKETLLAELDAFKEGFMTHQAESATQFERLQHYNAPRSVPYEGGDNRWRDISGIGFYYASTSDVGYPAAGILIHFRLGGLTGITWQMFLGTSGNVYTRRVIGSADFADVGWVAV